MEPHAAWGTVGNESFVRLADHVMNGVAYCRIVRDARAQPTDWIYLYANPAFRSQTGLPDPAGMLASELFPGIHESDPQLLEIYSRVATSGVPERFETYVEGLGHWFLVNVHSPKPEDFVACFDVTSETRSTTDGLQQSKDRLAIALRASRSAVWDWDITKGDLEWSEEMFELFGLDPVSASASFDVWRKVLHPEDREAAEARVQEAIETKSQLFNDYRVVLPNGEHRWIRAYGKTYYDNTGKPTRMIGICLDATETKVLADGLASADAASRAKSAFIATMSHELRTPLNAIIGFSSVLLGEQAGPLNAEQTKQLAMIRQAGQKLLDLVSEILDIARIESGRTLVDLKATPLASTALEELALFRGQAEARGLHLKLGTVDHSLVAMADRKRLQQIIGNLLSNAIKYTDEGYVELSVHADAESALVRVKDTGIGIPAAEQHKLFVPFHRVQEVSSASRPGTGLGLSISRRLAQAMGGDVGMRSTVGAGSEFWVRLPLLSSSVTALT